MNDAGEQIAEKLRVAAIIWVALVVSIGMYWGVVVFIGRESRPDQAVQNASQIHLILLGVAFLIFLSAGVVRVALLKAGPAADAEQTLAAALQRLTTVTVVTGVLGESIALIGLLAFFLLRGAARFELFLILSLVTMIVHMPRASLWRRYLSDRFPGVTFDPS